MNFSADTCTNLYVFKQQEKFEMDEFERREKIGSKGKFKYFKKIFEKMFLTEKLFIAYFVWEHSQHIFFILRKKLVFKAEPTPPPLTDESAKNASVWGAPFSILP